MTFEHSPRPGQSERSPAACSTPLARPLPLTLEDPAEIPADVVTSDAPVPLSDADKQNFLRFSIYQILLRTAWIFKTESIIMPAVLDVIGGAGWLRGCLPMLNRFGQSVPPLLVSDWVRDAPLKKVGLALTTALMGVCFLGLSVIWGVTGGEASWWLPLVFLIVYAIFFAATGINQLQLNTISGKLIRFDYRGRVGMFSTLFGSILACTMAWILLRRWLPESDGSGGPANFTMIFGFTGVTFFLAAIGAYALQETPDDEDHPRRTHLDLFRSCVETLRQDRNFRRLTLIAALFGMYLTLFPHYQALARGRLELGLAALIPWVIAQNIGAALFSVPAGWLADRFGNRLVLQLIMLVLCLAPVLALGLARIGDAGQPWFNLVFLLLGLTPVTFRVLNNYTLEVTHNSEHPRYLSTLSLMMAGPTILTSSLFGLLVDWISFEFVFGLVIVCIFVGWLLTFTLEEPRQSR